MELWDHWSPEEKREMLEHCRTGATGLVLQAALDGKRLDRLLIQHPRLFSDRV